MITIRRRLSLILQQRKDAWFRLFDRPILLAGEQEGNLFGYVFDIWKTSNRDFQAVCSRLQ